MNEEFYKENILPYIPKESKQKKKRVKQFLQVNKTKTRQAVKKEQEASTKLHARAFDIPIAFKEKEALLINNNRKRRELKYGN